MNSRKALKFEKYSLGGHSNFILTPSPTVRYKQTLKTKPKKKAAIKSSLHERQEETGWWGREYTEEGPLGVFRKDIFNGNLLIKHVFLAPLSIREKQTETGDWYFHFQVRQWTSEMQLVRGHMQNKGRVRASHCKARTSFKNARLIFNLSW